MLKETPTELEKLTDTIESAITGIPAPIRKNFLKAFGQLCTSTVDIPVAWLEGKAAEIRATTDARIQIIKKSGEGIAEQVKVPQEYITKASSKYASKIIKEQINLDDITVNAAKDLSDKIINVESTSDKEIEEDWLNEFESHARLKSSDDMKLIFGKILSGEILKPGTFSIRTVRLISQLDNRAAKLFQLLCSQTISLRLGNLVIDARVVSINGNAASNTLLEYGLSFDNLNVLHEYGLIISDYNSYMPYTPCIINEKNEVGATFQFYNKQYALMPIDKDKFDKELKLQGVALTKAGKELLDIIPLEEKLNYRKDLFEYFENKHLQVVDIDL